MKIISIIRCTSLLWLLALAVCSNTFAHGINSERVTDLNQRIAEEPHSAALYVQRGRVQRDAEHWQAALNDYARALKIDPNFSEAYYRRGDALLQSGEVNAAIVALEDYLQRLPASPKGHALLARALVTSGKSAAATEHFDQAILHDGNPPPSIFVERARHLAALPVVTIDRIELGLEQGIAQHGPLVNYLTLLVDLNLEQGRPAKAQQWLQQLPAALANTPEWQLRQGTVSALLGQKIKAGNHFRAVLQTIDALPVGRQWLPAMVKLKQAAETALDRNARNN